jgi:hypothetical protein
MTKHRISVGGIAVGVLEALLLLRLVALLFAARPDNPAIAALLLLTGPLTAPFGSLDRWAGQPRFGARLELATLAALLLIALVALLVQWRSRRRARAR